ncbi:FAD/NAD(P)-binding domain-containing protein, partial [Corynespora cassiicola Philippines]
VERDVAVLGGGSSGTYTSVRLHESGKSVVVIEMEDHLGGHAQTYFDPVSGKTVNAALKSYYNTSITRNYWKTLGIEPKKDALRLGHNLTSFDYSEHHLVEWDGPNTAAGLKAYRKVLDMYPGLLEGFDKLPDPVPKDLLLPFREFAEKHGFQEALYYLSVFGQGGVDYVNVPAVFPMKYLGTQFIEAVAIGLIVPFSRDNQEIYRNAQKYLGTDNLLLNSRVSSGKRSDDGVELHVISKDNSCTNVRAKKLVVAIPPILSNLAVLDLDLTETDLFGRVRGFGYFGALIRYPGWPNDYTYVNTGSSSTYHLGQLPNPHTVVQSPIEGLIDVKYGSGYTMVSPYAAKQGMIDGFNDVLASLPGCWRNITEEDIVHFASYGPYEQHVPVEDVATGFYRKLWGLQGKRSTYFTGAAWQAQDSSMIWNFTE